MCIILNSKDKITLIKFRAIPNIKVHKSHSLNVVGPHQITLCLFRIKKTAPFLREERGRGGRSRNHDNDRNSVTKRHSRLRMRTLSPSPAHDSNSQTSYYLTLLSHTACLLSLSQLSATHKSSPSEEVPSPCCKNRVERRLLGLQSSRFRGISRKFHLGAFISFKLS